MLAQPYSIAFRIIHNRATCEAIDDSVRVTTPVARWAYALEFPPLVGAPMLDTDMILRLRARVYEGEIGLGLLTPTREIHHETCVAANNESEPVEIPVPKGTALGPVMLRNTSVSGSSKADIEIVGCDAATGSEQPFRQALRFVHSQATCQCVGDLLRIITPAEQWAYAVEFPLHPGAAISETDRVLLLRARVYEGAIGLGLLTPNDALLYEFRVAASDESTLVEIPLPKGTVLGPLVLRNMSATGRSRADIEIAGCEIDSRGSEEIVIDPAIFASYKPWSGRVPSGFFSDWTGILTRVDVWAFKPDALSIFNCNRHESPSVPMDNDSVLDWVLVAQAVKQSGGTFRMAALGAGFGWWLAAGAALAAQTGRDYRLLGVEAEPQHFEWMLRHFKENNIPASRYIALNAAAVGRPGDCLFVVGNSQAWWGQAIYTEGQTLPNNAELRRTRGVTIDEMLSLLSPLDYLHMDIQGAELDFLSYQPDRLDRDVCLVNVGTHSAEIEVGLRKLFGRLGWECLYDVKLGSKHPIRMGDKVVREVKFVDGVQVWRNPHYLGPRLRTSE